MELQKVPKSQSNFKKENQSWRHHNSRLQAVLQSYNHQDSMVLAQKNWHTDQWNRTESPEMNPQIYSQLNLNKAGKNIQ